MNLMGKWKGYYEYGGGYRLPFFGERVEINVTFEGTNDKFIGHVNEVKSEFYVPLNATIKGFSEDFFISFIKRYPKKISIKEPSSSEIIIENGELEIEHEGYIDAKNESIYGKWYIYEISSDEYGEFESISDGIWFLKKVK